jgi:hypothetical protein
MGESCMKNIMLDLETLGTKPGSIVLSIGAVYFDLSGLGEEFYSVIRIQDSEKYGLTKDKSTVDWWSRQSKEAQDAISKASSIEAPGLSEVLRAFSKFVKPRSRIWGNGSDFDNVLLFSLYEAASIVPPWKFYNNRCFRTLKNLTIADEDFTEEKENNHNALFDAKNQAEKAVRILKRIPPRILNLEAFL